MTENADRIARMLDNIHGCDVDSVTVRGWDILPGPDCTLTAEGFEVVLKNSKGEYTSHTSKAANLTMKYNEEIILKITDGVLVRS